MKNLSDEARFAAIELLLSNSNKFGILASKKQPKAITRNYLSIFGRDASICVFGMVISQDKRLIKTAKRSLLTLASFQAENGQLPNYVKPEKKAADFWYTGCIDATLWWLLAIKFYDVNSGDKLKLASQLKQPIQKALNWLLCQEHPQFRLLSQNEASDWADIMPRSGFVLYTNALWFWVKTEYNLPKTKETKESFNYIFYPWQNVPKKYYLNNHRAEKLVKVAKENITKQENFLSYVNYLFYGTEVDVLGNLLAIISGVTDKKLEQKIINSLIAKKANKPWPIKTVLKPIKENSKNWREFMKRHKQNYPDQYQNGGSWPFIGGFWVIALIKLGKKELVQSELTQLAMLNKQNEWGFNEWFHGKTGEPMGMTGQSWSAAMYLFAYHINKALLK